MNNKKNKKQGLCSHIRKNGAQCRRKLTKKSKSDKCWQHRFSYNISIIPGIINIKITIPNIFITLIFVILIISIFLMKNLISIKEIWEVLVPSKKVIFVTEKFYQENNELVLNFSLINKNKKGTKIINDIQIEILAFLEEHYTAAIPREMLKQASFIVGLKDHEKSSEISRTNYKDIISLLREEKGYILEPKEIFPLSAKIDLNIDYPISRAIALFRLDIVYQEPSLKKNIIYSDEVYLIKSTLNLWPKKNEKRFVTEPKKWNTKKFIEDNLNILKKGLKVPEDFELFIIALGKLNYKNFVPILIDSLKKYENDILIFRLITKALGESKDKRAIKPLVKVVDDHAIRKEWEKERKKYAINSLANIGDRSAVPTIKKYFSEEHSFYFKVEAAQALNRLGENYDLTKIIIEGLNSNIDDETNALIFIIINKYCDERLIDILIKKFQGFEDYLKDSYMHILEEFILCDSISESSKKIIKKAISKYKSSFEFKEKSP